MTYYIHKASGRKEHTVKGYNIPKDVINKCLQKIQESDMKDYIIPSDTIRELWEEILYAK